MKNLIQGALFGIVLSVLVLAQTPAKKTERVPKRPANVAGSNRVLPDAKLDWSKISPIEFLELLQNG